MPKKKKKTSPVIDILKDVTVGTVATTVMHSLPATPQAPMLDVAKGFVGQGLALKPIISSSKGMLQSLKDLEKLGK
jgi:hypothetical protein